MTGTSAIIAKPTKLRLFMNTYILKSVSAALFLALGAVHPLVAVAKINPYSGNNSHNEIVVRSPEGLGLELIYNSSSQEGLTGNSFGQRWSGNSHHRLFAALNDATKVVVTRGDGHQLIFTLSGDTWTPPLNVSSRLTELKDDSGARIGWRYFDAVSRDTEEYDADGLLLKTTRQNGATYRYSLSDGAGSILYGSAASPTGYMAPACAGTGTGSNPADVGRVVCITDDAGRQINFTYNSIRVTQVQDANGKSYEFDYYPDMSLKSITYPNGRIRGFLYGEPAQINSGGSCSGLNTSFLLTGIKENGSRLINYTYDCQGRAASSELIGGLHRQSYAFNLNSTAITDPLNSTYTLTYADMYGKLLPTSHSQPGGAGCLAASRNVSYDIHGNLTSHEDFNGNRSRYGYDLLHNLLQWRVDGLGVSAGADVVKPETRTRVFTWDPALRLTTQLDEYTGTVDGSGSPTGSLVRSTSFSYNQDGNMLSKVVRDPVTNEVRTWSWTYLSRGRVETETDPLNRVTSYSYFSDTDADINKRGRLQSVTNPMGHVLSALTYNGWGQPTLTANSNNVTTAYVWNDLGQLLSETTAGETITYAYTTSGNLQSVTNTDGAQLTYSYDAAQRLAQVEDNLGNKITYTLDTAGNRILEETRDAAGTLAARLTRVFDALGRLQQITEGQ